ncbi:MAG: DUF2909 domain-containing protein [Pseudomonadales bacterium]
MALVPERRAPAALYCAPRAFAELATANPTAYAGSPMPTPLLKVLILVLFVAVLASLSSALMFLFKDHETGRKRTLYALGLRITLAIALMSLVGYGLQTGQLTLGAPWHGAAQ